MLRIIDYEDGCTAFLLHIGDVETTLACRQIFDSNLRHDLMARSGQSSVSLPEVLK